MGLHGVGLHRTMHKHEETVFGREYKFCTKVLQINSWLYSVVLFYILVADISISLLNVNDHYITLVNW